jgi:nucleotide-binding universal stress UspA family protein
MYLKPEPWKDMFVMTTMTNGIVCTTDFSESSLGALKWSIESAKRLGSHLTILHTYRLNQNSEAISLKRKLDEEAKKNFRELEREHLVGSGINYDFKTEVGFVDDRIAEHLKLNKISFLVMGKGLSLHNKESFDDLLNQLQIPLVIIP